MSTYLPAPYESAADDDLGAAAQATLAGALGALVAISLGMQAWKQFNLFKSAVDADLGSDTRAQAVVVTTAGWALAAVLMGLAAILLLFRRGRGALVLGSLVGIATTAVARYAYDWFTPVHPLADIAVYYGGIAVLVFALLPGTRRWVTGRGRTGKSGLPPVISATALTPTRVQIGQAR